MGTTAEKLSYLNETKTKIKNALETPSNTFRDYPTMIKKYIDNQPTKIVTNGICDNAVELPIVSLKSKGNNYQETTQGKNLFDNTLKDYAYYGNLAKTISTGVRLSVSSPITTSDIIFTVYSIMDLSNFVGKTVRMKATYKSNSALTGKYKIGLCDDKAGNRNAKASSSFTGQEISFIVPEIIEEQKYLAIWFYTNAGGTGATGDYVDYTNVIVTIDNEDMTYEPYTEEIPSPSPEYPQEIEVIDGANRFDGEVEAGWISLNGNLSENANRTRFKDFKKVKSGENYYLSSLGITSSENWWIYFYDKNKQFISYTSATQMTALNNIFETPVNCEYIKACIAVQSLTVSKITLTMGATSHPYLPYGSIGLKQSGKNKFDNFKEYSYSNSNLNATSLSNGIKIEKKGGFGLWVFDNLENLDGKIVRAKSKFNDGGSIAIGLASLDGTSRTVMKENTKSDTVSSFVIPKITDDKKYLAVWLYGTDNSEISYEDLIITIDNEDMTYEPYHEPKVIEINLNGNTLAKVGDIKDKLIIHRNGEVELEKKVRKYVFTGEELWNQSSYGEKSWILPVSYVSAEKTNSTINVISNIFNGVSSDDRSKKLKNKIYTDNSSGAIVIRDTQLTTLEDVRVATKDNYIYYKLITPQTIKLTSIEPIKLWQGTNIFKLITNLETNFEVEYVVDKDSMLDEVQTAMLNAEIEI